LNSSEAFFVSLNASIRRLIQRVNDYLAPPAFGLGQPGELEQAIRRERSRADRTGSQFAVVSFFANGGQHDRRLLLPLVEHLKHRSRSVDDLGWSHDDKLWLILTNCSEEAAANLASEQCRRCSSEQLKLAFTLYHYAADRIRNPPKQPEAIEAGAKHLATGQFDLRSNCEADAVDEPMEIEVPHVESCDTMVCDQAHSMDALFVRNMPWWKRSFDVIVSAFALILLSPLFVIIAVAIKLNSPGPVLFRQFRSGRSGRPFLLYKFRSMRVDAESQKQTLLAFNEQDGPAFKMEQDPRVTRVGRILRALSIDELPQFWNVLRGDMSLVGPRPLPIEEAEACLDWQRQRTDVTPGLTCFWQVKDRRAKIPFVEWARMDIRYISGRSIWVDVRLLAQTILFVIRRKGI
jgi:lipopolysaccharide/colanic/teichoic acid biosynthesis glycosyltransferase